MTNDNQVGSQFQQKRVHPANWASWVWSLKLLIWRCRGHTDRFDSYSQIRPSIMTSALGIVYRLLPRAGLLIW